MSAQPEPPEPPASKAMDILTADGVPIDRAASYALAAETAGKDPVAWAAHFVQLRKAARRSRQ